MIEAARNSTVAGGSLSRDPAKDTVALSRTGRGPVARLSGSRLIQTSESSLVHPVPRADLAQSRRRSGGQGHDEHQARAHNHSPLRFRRRSAPTAGTRVADGGPVDRDVPVGNRHRRGADEEQLGRRVHRQRQLNAANPAVLTQYLGDVWSRTTATSRAVPPRSEDHRSRRRAPPCRPPASPLCAAGRS